jgi:hypothetical protein
MGFLARLSLRARSAPSGAPALMPKGLAMRRPLPLFRAGEPAEEEEQAQPLRRTVARTMRRAADPPADEEATRRASGPAESEEDEQAMPARRSLHRAEDPEKDDPARPLRRTPAPPPGAADEEEDTDLAQARRLIRRAEEVPLEEGERPLRQPFQEDLSPGASPLPPEMANEEEPPAVQALRRDAGSFAAPPPSGAERPAAPGAGFEGFGLEPAGPFPATPAEHRPRLPAGLEAPASETAGAGGAAAPARPQVIIDQVDVLIHEPAAPAAPAGAGFDAGRAMRARYLRRL